MSKTIEMKARAKPPTEADKWVESRSALPDPPRPPQRRLTVEIDIDLHKELKIHCARLGINIADLIRQLIAREVNWSIETIRTSGESASPVEIDSSDPH